MGILAPGVTATMLSLISGIIIDLYSPSLPNMALYFGTSFHLIKSTVSITLFGLGVGSIFFGFAIDKFGSKFFICLGMFGFSLLSLYTVYATNITQLMILRFLQGAFGSSAFLGARALLMKNFSGKEYFISMTYASLGFGVGPVIGPFFGSYLEYFFGWKASFIVYGMVGFLFFLIVLFLINEPNIGSTKISLKQEVSTILTTYFNMLKHPWFLLSILILGMVITQSMVFPTIWPFIVTNILHESGISYGVSALTIGAGYLFGTLSNRVLLNFYSPKFLLKLGIYIFLCANLIQLYLLKYAKIDLYLLTFVISLMSYALGFFYANVTSFSIQLFPQNPSMVAAIQGFFMIIIGSGNNYLISRFNFINIANVSRLYMIFFAIQFVLISILKTNQKLKLL